MAKYMTSKTAREQQAKLAQEQAKLAQERFQESTAQQAYLDALKSRQAAPFSHTKFGLLGEGRAGKTSTCKSLVGEAFKSAEPSTVGMDATRTVTVEQTHVVNFTQRGKEDQFKLMAARAAAARLAGKPTTTASDLVEDAPPLSPAPPTSSSSATSTSNPNPASGLLRRLSSASRLFGGGPKAVPPPTSKAPPAAQATTLPSPLPTATDINIDVARIYDKVVLDQAMREEQDPNHRPISMAIFDMGGQEVFRSLAPVIVTNAGIYAIVFDMQKFVSPNATDRSNALLTFTHWLNLARSTAPSASLLLIGTHKDVVSKQEDFLTINEILHQDAKLVTIPNIVTNKQDELWFFPINNAVGAAGDPVIPILREAILGAVKASKHVQALMPVDWLRVLDTLNDMRDSQDAPRPFVTREEVENLCGSFGVPLHEVSSLLGKFHDLGAIIYFKSNPDMYDFVVLSPQWLIDQLTCVIRDEKWHARSLIQNDDLRKRYGQEYNDLFRRGLLSKPLLMYLWNHLPADVGLFLLRVMNELHLLCPWIGGTTKGDDADVFLVPTMLEMDSKLATLPEEEQQLDHLDAAFDLDFIKSFLPAGVFLRLVAMAVRHGSARFQDSRKPNVSQNRAILSFGLECEFVMTHIADKHRIQVDVTGDVPIVLEYLSSMLEGMGQDLIPSLAFDVVLHAGTSRVTMEQAKAARAGKHPEAKYRSQLGNGVVNPVLLNVFFELPKPDEIVPKQDGKMWDLYLAHKQDTGGEQVLSLHLLLKEKQVTSWLDQNAVRITGPEMEHNITASRRLLLFLSRDVFKSDWVKFELKKALDEKMPVILMHERDPERPGYARFKEIIEQAPLEFKSLFSQVDSIAYERRIYLRDAMMKQLLQMIRGEC